MKKLGGIFYLGIILLLEGSSTCSAQPKQCNGSAELCDRRYNECTYAVTHNAQSNRKNPLFSILKGNISNQTRGISKQLEQGIRGMKLPLYESDNEVFACHGMNPLVRSLVKNKVCGNLWLFSSLCEKIVDGINPCRFDPATKPLEVILRKIDRFLQANPNEVITLFLEDHGGDFAKLMATFEKEQLTSYLHGQSQNSSWPTLGEMIENNKRLVVFINRERDKNGVHINSFPLFNNQKFFSWGTQFTFRTLEHLRNDGPHTVKQNQFALARWNDFPKNKIWIMQHFVTPTVGGHSYLSGLANQADTIRMRIKKFTDAGYPPPNFIWVDFYELPSLQPGIFNIILELNQLQASE